MITLKEIEVVGSFQFNREFEEAVRFVESSTIDFDALTSRRCPLAETAEALELMDSGEAYGKVVLTGADAPIQ